MLLWLLFLVCVCVCVVICFDVVGLLYRSYVIIIYYLLLGEVRWVFFLCVGVFGRVTYIVLHLQYYP